MSHLHLDASEFTVKKSNAKAKVTKKIPAKKLTKKQKDEQTKKVIDKLIMI